MRAVAVVMWMLIVAGCASKAGQEPVVHSALGNSPFDRPMALRAETVALSKSERVKEAAIQCNKAFPGVRGAEIVKRASCLSDKDIEIFQGDINYDLVLILARQRVVLAEKIAANRMTAAEARFEFAKTMSELKDRMSARAYAHNQSIEMRHANDAAVAQRQAEIAQAERDSRSASGALLLGAGLQMMAAPRPEPMVTTSCNRLTPELTTCTSR